MIFYLNHASIFNCSNLSPLPHLLSLFLGFFFLGGGKGECVELRKKLSYNSVWMRFLQLLSGSIIKWNISWSCEMHMTSLIVKFNLKSSHPLTQISLSLSKLQYPRPFSLSSITSTLCSLCRSPLLGMLNKRDEYLGLSMDSDEDDEAGFWSDSLSGDNCLEKSSGNQLLSSYLVLIYKIW